MCYLDNHTGVKFDRRANKWVASICYQGKSMHLLQSISKTSCVKVRILAEKAKENNAFDDFYRTLCIKRSALYR